MIRTIGRRMDRLQEKDRIEILIRSLSRFSKKALLILSGQSEVSADAVKIGPSIIFERLWKETGIQRTIKKMLAGRKFEFDVERAIFLTVFSSPRHEYPELLLSPVPEMDPGWLDRTLEERKHLSIKSADQ